MESDEMKIHYSFYITSMVFLFVELVCMFISCVCWCESAAKFDI